MSTDNKALLASYEERLAGLVSEREKLSREQAALEKIISGMRELISLNGGGGGSQAAVSQIDEPVIAKNAFQRMEIVEGTVAYLRIMKKPLTTRHIVNGLLQGGYKTHAKIFINTVRSVLQRDAKKPKSLLVWTENHWELKEWWHATEEQVKELFG